jgi:hypothetical protein
MSLLSRGRRVRRDQLVEVRHVLLGQLYTSATLTNEEARTRTMIASPSFAEAGMSALTSES